ncbi:MAG: DinB family protein [Ignavibacteriae bacterium]|nr:MAG: DinB family protein [Ignavibacteriota bacterium]
MKFNLTYTIQILNNTPQVIRNLLSDLPDELVHSNEGGDSWSPYDIVGHLVHGERTDWFPRTEIILSNKENKKFIPYDRFAQFEESKGKSLEDLLNEFSELRIENIHKLKNMDIDEEKLNMEGIHPEFGNVTLRELLSTWAAHDLTHIAQISRVLAKQYKEEIGPWIKYFDKLKA